MDIEIVEFYPIERDDRKKILKGTLRIFLPEINADLRFVLVNKKNHNWFFSIPTFPYVDLETKKKKRAYVFSFLDSQKNKDLIKDIIAKGKPYIIENFLEKQNADPETGRC